MKYYCKYCGSEFKEGNLEDIKIIQHPFYCIFCGHHEDLVNVPDYETPAQYKERTGECWKESWFVWYRAEVIDTHDWTNWGIASYEDAIYYTKRVESDGRLYEIVIANPVVPPPDDRRPQ